MSMASMHTNALAWTRVTRILFPGLVFIISGIAANPLQAQEVYALAGWMQTDTPVSSSYAWTLSYAQNFSNHISASYSWLNEGHFPGHHRDGNVTQLWWRSNPLGGFTFAGGAGVYRYFDTVLAENPSGYADAHGWGIVYSLSATHSLTKRLDVQVRVDRVALLNHIDTTSAMVGFGWKLAQDHGTEESTRAFARPWEVTLLAGQTIVNSFSSPKSLATSAELRWRWGSVLRVSASYVNEGDDRIIRRNGTLAEGWLEPSFFDDRVTFGVGVGGYLSIDHHQPEGAGRSLSGVVTTTTSWNIVSSWVVRASWHRIVTNYNRDSDILLMGIGYRL